jgi:hypothetical protein
VSLTEVRRGEVLIEKLRVNGRAEILPTYCGLAQCPKSGVSRDRTGWSSHAQVFMVAISRTHVIGSRPHGV